jgi:hypothetical protein
MIDAFANRDHRVDATLRAQRGLADTTDGIRPSDDLACVVDPAAVKAPDLLRLFDGVTVV